MKAHTVMQVEDVSQRIGNLPTFSKRGHVQVIVAGEQVVEDQVVDPLRLSVEADAGIEVGRAAFDDHDQGVGVGLARAG